MAAVFVKILLFDFLEKPRLTYFANFLFNFYLHKEGIFCEFYAGLIIFVTRRCPEDSVYNVDPRSSRADTPANIQIVTTIFI